MIKEFKEFIARGNVLDLAVAVIIGGAFTKIVNAVVVDLINPIISFLTNGVPFKDLTWTPVKGVDFKYGDVLSVIITFLITAFVVFLIVKAVNKLMPKPVEEETAEELDEQTELLKEIRDALKAR
ncbi:MAG TPA: large conductance mechanosensitive channel protein MscL [Lactobacillaceae bacterium]|jgi:large conductance mechanosensitive channel